MLTGFFYLLLVVLPVLLFFTNHITWMLLVDAKNQQECNTHFFFLFRLRKNIALNIFMESS